MSMEKLFVGVVLSIFLIGLACGSGYWMARYLPVRFNGEKVLIGFLTGILVSILTFGADRLMDVPMQPSRVIMTLGWFLLQGVAGEVTVQVAARRKRNIGI